MINVYNINNQLFMSALELYDLLGLAKAAYHRWVNMNVLDSSICREGIEYLKMERVPKVRRTDYYLHILFVCELCNGMKHNKQAIEIRNYLMDSFLRTVVKPETTTV